MYKVISMKVLENIIKEHFNHDGKIEFVVYDNSTSEVIENPGIQIILSSDD